MAFHRGIIKALGNGFNIMTAKKSTKGNMEMTEKAIDGMPPQEMSLFVSLCCISNGYNMVSFKKLGKNMKLKSKHDDSDKTKGEEIIGKLPGFIRKFDRSEPVLTKVVSGDLPISKVNGFKAFNHCT
jgi:hypothetical protein